MTISKNKNKNIYDSMNIEQKQMNKNNFMMNLVFTNSYKYPTYSIKFKKKKQ